MAISPETGRRVYCKFMSLGEPPLGPGLLFRDGSAPIAVP